ncbi:MAG: AsmA family protein, partial [Thermodesulfobacteriota bacterium]
MARFAKLAAGILGAILLIALGLAIFVRVVLTEERLKAALLPKAEEALGRQITVGRMQVGLLTGIAVRDVAVKEADGRTDFIRVGAVLLRYDLGRLLKREVLITELRLVAPFVRLVRSPQGAFNFDSLALLAAASDKPAPAAPAAPPAAPLALSIRRLAVESARLEIRDGQQQLPATDVSADLDLGVDLGPRPAAVRLVGQLRLAATATCGQLAPRLEATLSGSDQALDLAGQLQLGEER